jgi:uncharacterized delta-60 repeat protein
VSQGAGGDAFLARFLPDGDPDFTFGWQGNTKPYLGGEFAVLRTMHVDRQGYITACGKAHVGMDHALLARFTPDGQVDETFGTNGAVLVPPPPGQGIQGISAYSMVRDAEGRWLLACSGYINDEPRAAVIRLTENGALDTTFGESGYAVSNITLGGFIPFVRFTGIGLLPDGTIVATGFRGNPPVMQGWLAFFKNNGDIADQYGENGNVWHNPSHLSHESKAIHITPEGRILCAGNMGSIDFKGMMLSRHLPTGTPDPTWGNNGYNIPLLVENGSFGSALLPPVQVGRPWIVAGHNGPNFALIQVTDNGSLDTGFGWQGGYLTPVGNGLGQINALGRQSDGKIVAAGFRHTFGQPANRISLLRYSSSSTLHTNQVEAARILPWPNPTTGVLHLAPDAATHGAQLTDVHGKAVASLPPGATSADLSHLAQGVYIVQLHTARGVVHHRIVKQ